MSRTASGFWRGRRWPRRVAVWGACLLLGFAAARAIEEAPETGVPPGLQAPTSPAYADVAWYDLLAVRWVEPAVDTVWLEVEVAAADPAGPGPLGLRQPIIEVYVDDGGGGAATLLPGSGLRMPEGDGWHHAVRVTGDGVWWWEAAADGRGLLPPRPLPAVLDGRVVRIAWPAAAPPADARVYAVSGVYDPFSADGWRPLAGSASPWAFASEAGGPPVIDVLPGGTDAWARVREGRALVRDASATGGGGWGARWAWWVLMAAGLAMASGGLWWRSRPPARARQAGAQVAGPSAPPSNAGAEDLISDAELGPVADPGAIVPPSAVPAAADEATGPAPQPAATPPAAGPASAGAVADGASDGSSTRVTDAPSDDSRSAKRS